MTTRAGNHPSQATGAVARQSRPVWLSRHPRRSGIRRRGQRASRVTRPSPPLSCGVARRWHRRALPTCEAGGRAVSGGAGGPGGAATAEERRPGGGNDAGTQRLCPQRGLHAPRYPARGAGRQRRRSARPLSCGRAPPSGWVGLLDCGGALRNGERPARAGGSRKNKRSRASPAAILPPCAASVGSLSGESPTQVPFLPPLSCGGGTVAREPTPFPARYPAGVGGGDRVCGLFYPDDRSNGGRCACDCPPGGCSRSPGACYGGRCGGQGCGIGRPSGPTLPHKVRKRQIVHVQVGLDRWASLKSGQIETPMRRRLPWSCPATETLRPYG